MDAPEQCDTARDERRDKDIETRCVDQGATIGLTYRCLVSQQDAIP
jgi:hypothetical protein